MCGNRVSDLEWDDHIFAHDLDEPKPKKQSYQHSDSESSPAVDQDMFHADEKMDELLARILQEEEEKAARKKEQEEQDEFQRLQSLHGMNSKTGYAKQYLQSISKDVSKKKLSIADYFERKGKLLETLISNNESGDSRTSGVINKLQKHINEGPSGSQVVTLCCPTDHFSSSYGDKGWGCGYRNLQMLLSALVKIDSYKTTILKVLTDVPSIPKIQQLIEDAWQEGYDQQGASQLGNKLSGTSKWIGATEIAVILKYIGLRAHIIDFHQPTANDGTHSEMSAWIGRYFHRAPNQIFSLSITPVYLQHQGHSRLVIGIEEKLNKTPNLLLFDPSHSQDQMQTFSKKKDYLTLFRRSLKQMRSKQYQIVYVDGIMETEERQKSKLLTSTRIP